MVLSIPDAPSTLTFGDHSIIADKSIYPNHRQPNPQMKRTARAKKATNF